MTEWLVRQQPGDRVPRHALGAPRVTLGIVLDDTALDHRPASVKTLSDRLQPQLIQAAERGQARRGEGSVGHVEVLRMRSLGISILGGPRPLPTHRHAHTNRYTLNCEEPLTVSSFRAVSWRLISPTCDCVSQHSRTATFCVLCPGVASYFSRGPGDLTGGLRERPTRCASL